MTCRICAAKADAYRHAARTAVGDYAGFVASPNSRALSQLFVTKSQLHESASLSHDDTFHDEAK